MQAFGDDDVRHRGDQRDVGAGPQLQVEVGLHVRAVDHVVARVGHDQLRAPWRRRRFMRDANTGCAAAGLAPMTMITSDFSTDLKVCVPADVP